jgi:hypothetical protein
MKANRASLLWLALFLSRCKSMSPYAFDSDVASDAKAPAEDRYPVASRNP